jgi:hypothetical protein
VDSIDTAALGLLASNLTIDSQEVILQGLESGAVNVNSILGTYPLLLTLSDSAKIDAARQAFTDVVNGYKETADYWLNNEDNDQSDDLLIPTEYFWANEPRYRVMAEQLNTLQDTLIDPTTEITGDEFHLNLAEYFINYKNLRQFLPSFDDENHVIEGSLPEETFGGIITGKEF